MNLTYCRTLTEKRIDIGYLIDFRTYLYQLEEGSSNRVNFFKDFLHMYVIVFFGFIFLTTSIVRLIDFYGLASWNVRIVRWFPCAIYSEKGRNEGQEYLCIWGIQ